VQSRELLITKTLVSAHKAKVQSQRARVMLFGEYPCIYRRIGLSRSNLTYEGLLLGMRAGGHGDPRARASPSEVNHSEPSLYNDTCGTLSHFLQEKLPTRWSFGLVGVRAEQDRTEDSQREAISHRRLSPHKRRWMVPKVISASELQVSSVTAQWTRVMTPLVRHENIFKSQRTVMTP
jgi:hypothetical protein